MILKPALPRSSAACWPPLSALPCGPIHRSRPGPVCRSWRPAGCSCSRSSAWSAVVPTNARVCSASPGLAGVTLPWLAGIPITRVPCRRSRLPGAGDIHNDLLALSPDVRIAHDLWTLVSAVIGTPWRAYFSSIYRPASQVMPARRLHRTPLRVAGDGRHSSGLLGFGLVAVAGTFWQVGHGNPRAGPARRSC